jgi:hypothetical protein
MRALARDAVELITTRLTRVRAAIRERMPRM